MFLKGVSVMPKIGNSNKKLTENSKNIFEGTASVPYDRPSAVVEQRPVEKQAAQIIRY